MNLKKATVLLLSVFFLVSMMTAGCQQAAKKPTVPYQKTKVQIPKNTSMTASDKRVMASKFSTLAENVAGVKSATVVVETAGNVQNTGTTTGTITGTSTSPMPNENARTSNQPGMNNYSSPSKPGTPAPMPPKGTVMQTNKLVAMVGITMADMSMKGTAKEGNIKQMVKQRIMDSDKQISEVLVTTDPNMVKIIRDVAAGVIGGKPISAYAKDVNTLNTMMRK